MRRQCGVNAILRFVLYIPPKRLATESLQGPQRPLKEEVRSISRRIPFSLWNPSYSLRGKRQRLALARNYVPEHAYVI